MSSLQILNIALPIPLYRQFDYLPPKQMGDVKLKIGMRVRVNFRTRTMVGIIIGKSKSTTVPIHKLKPVTEILDKKPIIPLELFQLLRWTANYYQQPLGEVLFSALPSMLRKGKPIVIPRKEVYKIYKSDIDKTLFNHAPKQKKIFNLLLSHSQGLNIKQVSEKIPNPQSSLQALSSKKLIKKVFIEENIAEKNVTEKIFLNSEQSSVSKKIKKNSNSFSVHLLAGVTGSGKTEVYLSLAQKLLKKNKQILFLVPEIGLTPEYVHRIKKRLGVHVDLMHSGLNETERVHTWQSAKIGSSTIIVGTRSAVFLPFKDLGLIVVDEEHDQSFKQQEGVLYHARDLAIYRAKQLDIPIILGSATPSFESLVNVDKKKFKKYQIKFRAKKSSIPKINLVDLRSQKLIDGLSHELLHSMEDELDKNNQVLLFLNRRGYAPLLMCPSCSWVSECSRCDARMTYYKTQQTLKCHYCQKKQPAPKFCPNCSSEALINIGEGTQKIESRLKNYFSTYSIIRIDRDSTRRKNELENKLEQIKNGQHQIIIGTQMLSKGHDFPNVTLVGILNIDQGLFSTDFRATEKLAQLLVQVSGRAGRAKKTGKVFLQTYQPAHPLLSCLLSNGYNEFAKQALKSRKSCDFPPYTSMLLVRAQANQQQQTQKFLTQVKRMLDIPNQKLKLFGPIPALMAKKAGMYQSQLLVIAQNKKILQKSTSGFAEKIQQSPLAKRVRWEIEIDPLEIA